MERGILILNKTPAYDLQTSSSMSLIELFYVRNRQDLQGPKNLQILSDRKVHPKLG